MKMLKLTDYYDDQVLTWRQYYLLSDFYFKLSRESIGYTFGVRKPHMDDFTYFHPSVYIFIQMLSFSSNFRCISSYFAHKIMEFFCRMFHLESQAIA